MKEQEVFVLADRALNDVVGQIKQDQWAMTMSNMFAMGGAEPVTLRQVVNGHAHDDAWLPDMLAGRTMSEVGEDKWSGDILGDNPTASFAIFVNAACEAAQALDEPEQTVHCSFGDYTARQYLWQVTAFRGMRAYDIAVDLDLDPTLPDELVTGMWEQLTPVADEWRGYGVFGPKVEVPEDAPLMDRLLGLTGRQPRAAGSA
ncbi:MAG: TIGR03086 family protein [Geodermatophilaceae bacterium]|nr:TIGR03086 family protein [Geodermatophilaceae bacterium]